MAEQPHAPTPWLRDGHTIYALNAGGTNRMVFSVQGGWQNGYRESNRDSRTTVNELLASAAFIVEAVNSHASLEAKVKRLTEALRRIAALESCGEERIPDTPGTLDGQPAMFPTTRMVSISEIAHAALKDSSQ